MQNRAIKILVVAATVVAWAAVFLLSWWLFPVDSSRRLLGNIATSYLMLWGLYWLLSASSPVEKSLRFLLTTTSLLVMTVVLEFLAFARIVDYRLVFKMPVSDLRHHPQNLLDPELLHIHKPHAHVRGSLKGDIAQDWGLNPSPAYHFDIRYDRNGFRNAADYESADIIVIGDSFLEAWNMRDEELFTTHLAKLSNKTVVNLGQSAYGPQQELHVLRRFGIAFRPKVCFWLFFEGNDLSDVRNYNEVVANWGGYAQRLDALSDRLFTRNLLWALVRRFHEPVQKGSPNSGLFVGATGEPVRMYFAYPGSPLSEEDLKALEETRSSLAAAHELCRQNGIQLVVVFTPAKFRVYKEFCEFEPDSACQRWVINDLPQRLKTVVQSISDGIPYVDLTPALVERVANGPLLYLTDDTHWTTEGHRIVAQTLAESLRQRPQTD